MAAALLSFSACSDSFLDRETDGSFITPDQLEESAKWNPKVLLGQTQGITTSLIRWQAGGTDSQSDFGQKSVDISTDLMSHDMRSVEKHKALPQTRTILPAIGTSIIRLSTQVTLPSLPLVAMKLLPKMQVTSSIMHKLKLQELLLIATW